MSVARVQVSMERDSLLPADRIVNTLHYKSRADLVVQEDWTLLASGVASAWGPRMASLFGSTLEGSVTVQVYDLEEATPRVPRAETTSLANTVSSTALPAELAVCLSMRGAYASGFPQARSRGRIFLGPLPTSAAAAAAGGEVRVASAYRSSAIGLGQDLESIAGSGTLVWDLAVFSERDVAAGLTVGQATKPVVEFWVDDSFDVQRKRGAQATTRTTALVVK